MPPHTKMKKVDALFFSSLFLSRLADQVILFLVPLVVFQITGSTAMSGLAFFLEALPRFLAFPVSGILCDHISPLKVLRSSQLVRFLIIALSIIGYLLINNVYWLVGMSAVVGVATSFGVMGREIILPQVYKSGRFEKVLAYSSLSDQIGMVLGPIVAAFLITFADWQIASLFAAGLFVLSDLFLQAWYKLKKPIVRALDQNPINLLTAMTTSFLNIFSLPGLFPAIVLAFSINLLLGVTLATMAPIFTGDLGQSEAAYGVLQTLGALATIAVILFVSRVRMSLVRLGFVGFFAMTIGAYITSFSQSAPVYAFGFLLVIGFDKMFNIFVRGLRAAVIPPSQLGKTSGFVVLLNNLSQPLAGLMVASLGGVMEGQEVVLLSTLIATALGLIVFSFLGRTKQLSLGE